MGADTSAWREACFDCVSFGDVLGGATAQAAITDCGERFIPSPAREILQGSIYMDDLMLGAAGKVDTMIKECDKGLKKGSFVVKEWIKTNDDKDTKFLSYTYHAFTDTFSARPKINWAPKK